jgi:general secretion pathway protein G
MHYQFERIRARRRAEGKEPGLIDSGFTLIELLIVIVVLGILAAVVIFALSSVSGQSRQSSCNADAKSVEVAAAAMHTQTGSWPATVNALVPTYLRTAPSTTNGYSIGIDATGGATVTVGTANPQPYDTQSQAASTGCFAIPTS